MALALDQLAVDDFVRCLGSRFQVDLGAGHSVDLELIEATGLRPRASGSERIRTDPFAILLRGPVSPVLAQRIQHLAHAELGPIELFIVPVGPDEHGQRYEAIFN